MVACKESYVETYWEQVNEPVFMSESEFRSSVVVSHQAQKISNYGKICFYEGYLFVSESGKGIHIIDNTDPSNPKNTGFIELLGNADISVRDNMLYADSYIDLVWFDVSNPSEPVLKGRLEAVFPEVLPVIDNGYGYDYESCFPTDGKRQGIIVGWKLGKVKRERVIGYGMEEVMLADKATNSGVNGSMSRFCLYGKYLYTVMNSQMQIFYLSPEKPEKVSENIYIGDVETIFSYKDCLFLGTPTGMSIYSVKDPISPIRCSTIWHVLGCDPVVVEDDLAYVTVHSGNFCGQNNDELFVVDVSDVEKPKQLVSYAMTNPKGLGIENGILFLCDDGLKVFNAKDPYTLVANILTHIKGMDGYDLIPYKQVLMMIADDGLYQYDYSNLDDIKQLSVIPIN
jgi:hypothetical protein